jgi:hypothetical protein
VGTASGPKGGGGKRTASASAARSELREHIDLFSTAAARALYRAPEDDGACWADLHLSDGSVRPCGEPEATSLGLCAFHRAELLGPDAR